MESMLAQYMLPSFDWKLSFTQTKSFTLCSLFSSVYSVANVFVTRLILLSHKENISPTPRLSFGADYCAG